MSYPTTLHASPYSSYTPSLGSPQLARTRVVQGEDLRRVIIDFIEILSRRPLHYPYQYDKKCIQVGLK